MYRLILLILHRKRVKKFETINKTYNSIFLTKSIRFVKKMPRMYREKIPIMRYRVLSKC